MKRSLGHGWEVVDHICRACLGRVLRAEEADTVRFRCADCGAQAFHSVENLCTCGAKLRTGKNAGMRCQRNPDAGSAESPPEVVSVFVGIERKSPPVGPRLSDYRLDGEWGLPLEDGS